MNKATILIVEDDAILAMDLQRMISQQGYTAVDPFASGEEAIAFFLDNQVDLVLMDIELAGAINGIRTAEIIRQTSDVPIVFLTGFSHDPLLEEAKIVAPYGYLIKPVPERELAATLEMALHRHSLDRQLQEKRLELKKSEEKFRQLFENSPLGIFRTTLEGRVLAVNSEMARIFGSVSPEEAIADFTHLADQFYVDPMRRQQFITQLKAEGAVQHFEYEGRKKNGETLWISMNAHLTPTDAANGQSGEMVIDGFALDITDRKRAEQTLRDSEAKFRSLAESSRDYIMRYDRQGRHTYMNPAALAISGLTEADIIGKTHRDCGFPEELCALWEEKIIQVFSSGEPYQLEFSWNSIAGPVYLDWQLTPEHDAEDRVFSVLGVSRDITDRKRAEEENRRFKTIADNAVYGKAIGDLEGNLLYVNRFFANIHGYEPEQLIGKHLSLFHSQDQMEAVDRLIATMMQERCFATTTVWHCHKDGRAFPMLMNGNLIDDDSGTPRCLAVSAIDISAHHLAQESLRESEERFRSYFNLPLIGFAITSLEKGWIEVNERLCEIFGYPREELLTLTWTAITHPEDMERDVEQFNLILEGVSDNYSLEKRFIRKDGSVIHGSISVCCVRKPDRTINYFVALVQDITDRKQADAEREKLQAQLQQAQKMEAIGTLSGGIAHDFNNILGAIVGYAEMIRDDFPPDSPGIHDINQVLKASHRAKDLVKQILTFSRQMEGQKNPMHPAVIVKEAINLLRSSLPTTITINQDIAADAGMVLADPIQIHQIVMNLCTNAFHAMEAKGGTLTISLQNKLLSQDDLATESDLKPGTFVQLSIKDTGEGISPEIQEKIFDPFFTTKEVGKGTGLGLSMVYSIVKSSGGSIACDSRLGEGTEFRIILPALEGHTVQENGSPELTPHGKEHILLIDDEEMLVELGKTMLERLGYHVTTRRSSLEALTTFHNQPDAFDLVITDQTMPGMTGVDFARRILQIRPEMPIILCTGYSSQIIEDTAKAAGITGFAFKPLAKKDIGDLIRKILDGKNSLSTLLPR